MENQEDEFQCSECGTEVQADTKICPNCGAQLDSSVEDELIEIPLTSDPAKLSAILSLLDEKKIEYSIHENPMENIWGPTFTQVPKILVRIGLEEEVKKIIHDIDKDEDYQIYYTEIIDAEYKVGAYFSIKSQESGYRIVKILVTDLLGVHIKLFSNLYNERPKKVNPEELFINPLKNDSNTFGSFHIPLRYDTFADEWQPEFIEEGILIDDDFVGYKIWKEERGGYF
jgi:hypothetical protein